MNTSKFRRQKVADPTFRYDTKSGEALPVGERMIIPVSRAMQIHLPGMKGGFIWNRPVGLWVQEPDGSEQFIPVRDVTRQAQMIFLGAGLVGSLLAWLVFRRKLAARQ
jgi:hypothetical protein